jgi:hypothetical protein
MTYVKEVSWQIINGAHVPIINAHNKTTDELDSIYKTAIASLPDGTVTDGVMWSNKYNQSERTDSTYKYKPESENNIETITIGTQRKLNFSKHQNYYDLNDGDYVFEPIVPTYEYQFPLDFRSLYPSIMVAYNLNWETLLDSNKSKKRVWSQTENNTDDDQNDKKIKT